MKILIVDDSKDNLDLMEFILNNEGYDDLLFAESAKEAFECLKQNTSRRHICKIDLILMDIMMPEIDGVEACSIIKDNENYKDIPIIMVTAKSEESVLKLAFNAGANDYITKPFKKVELFARVRSALRLKYETDWRKIIDQELLKVQKKLEDANKKLMESATMDGLTGIANRRKFDEFLHQQWRDALRNKISISVIMIDIDHFKAFNDTYGHLAGDQCLKTVAAQLKISLKRPTDLVARYGGEEFVIVIKDTKPNEVYKFADSLRLKIEKLGIENKNSKVSSRLTVSMGVATVIPCKGWFPKKLVAYADKLLYQSKKNGRNQVSSKCFSCKKSCNESRCYKNDPERYNIKR